MSSEKAILALADGSSFLGRSLGVSGEVSGEVVFNTSLTGYQEILTDPSYAKQIVTLTYPHIGNTGTNLEDMESEKIWASALVIKDLPFKDSSWRRQNHLREFLSIHNTICIAQIDTRKLTRQIRTKGAQSAAIITGKHSSEKRAIELARSFSGLLGLDLAKEVSTSKKYTWEEPESKFLVPPKIFKVVAIDFGIKRNILRILQSLGCEITVVPAKTSSKEILKLKPEGVFLSNGPGDPEPCVYAIETIKELSVVGLPLFGICLGHQLMALAFGAETEKMKFGHHGANHPVQDVCTKKVFITSQNHGFAVTERTLPSILEVTHRSLFDKTIQGIRHKELPAFSFQGHPEASPGPHDLKNLFAGFLRNMELFSA